MAGELRQLAWEARLRSAWKEQRVPDQPKGHHSFKICWFVPPKSSTIQPCSAEGLDSETQSASIPLCKEPWPKAKQRDPADKVGPAFRGKQNTRDKDWYTMALFKIIIGGKKKKKSIGNSHRLHQGQDVTQACGAALREGN